MRLSASPLRLRDRLIDVGSLLGLDQLARQLPGSALTVRRSAAVASTTRQVIVPTTSASEYKEGGGGGGGGGRPKKNIGIAVGFAGIVRDMLVAGRPRRAILGG